MIESITWYVKNTMETLLKFREIYIYIYIKFGNYEYISYILSLQFETVTVGIRALAWVQEWKKKTKNRGFNKFLTCTKMVRTRKGTMIREGFKERQGEDPLEDTASHMPLEPQ